MIDIRPIRTSEELDKLHVAASEDNHMLAWPSHHITKEGETVGALSILPTVLVWMHTKKTNIRDAIAMQKFYEGLVANQSRCVVVPVTLNSPLLPYMGKTGYIDLGQLQLFVKGV